MVAGKSHYLSSPLITAVCLEPELAAGPRGPWQGGQESLGVMPSAQNRTQAAVSGISSLPSLPGAQ